MVGVGFMQKGNPPVALSIFAFDDKIRNRTAYLPKE
jgi:hypothetical protein